MLPGLRKASGVGERGTLELTRVLLPMMLRTTTPIMPESHAVQLKRKSSAEKGSRVSGSDLTTSIFCPKCENAPASDASAQWLLEHMFSLPSGCPNTCFPTLSWTHFPASRDKRPSSPQRSCRPLSAAERLWIILSHRGVIHNQAQAAHFSGVLTPDMS